MSFIRKNDQLQGHVLTAQRRLLLDIIQNSGGPLDVRDLYSRASSKDCSISMATIYRSLRLFEELGLVSKISLGKTRCCYDISHSIEHQYIICKGCGKIIEFESSLITELIRNLQRKYDFEVTGAELCLEGYCQQCKKKTMEEKQP
jgi:Fur family transcriptional regulator, ferric uptake regulator